MLGLESLLQYELVKLKVCNKSTCVYRDYSGGVELQCNAYNEGYIGSGEGAVLEDDLLFTSRWYLSCC